MHAFLTEIIVNVTQYTQSHVLRFILQSYPNSFLNWSSNFLYVKYVKPVIYISDVLKEFTITTRIL